MLYFSLTPIIRQYAIVIIANLSVLCVGMTLAWPSPVLVKLGNDTTTVLSRPITEEEGSWIVSAGFISSLIANFITGYLVDRIGRKYCIILSYVPKFIMCLTLTFASEVWMLLAGRVIGGAADGIVLNVIPMYASEIASKEIRGSLGTILQIFSSLGIVIMMCIGPFTSYFTLHVVLTVVVVITFIPNLFVPDSPYFLHTKGRTEQSLKVLKYLRGSETAAQAESKEYTANQSGDNLKISKLELLRNKAVLKALCIVVVLGIGSQIIGFSAVSFYLQSILVSTDTTVQPEIASVIIGLLQLIASLCTTFVTDRFGRKPILTTTLAGMSIGMIGLGVFFKIKENHGVTGFLNFLPLISLILVVFCYSAGVGSLMWTLIAELFDGTTRAIGVSSCLVFSMLFVFLTSKYFALLTNVLGPPTTYWFFSVNSLMLCIFFLFCVPETKGKSFAEIQESLGAKKVIYIEEKCEKC